MQLLLKKSPDVLHLRGNDVYEHLPSISSLFALCPLFNSVKSLFLIFRALTQVSAVISFEILFAKSSYRMTFTCLMKERNEVDEKNVES
jgi:hypothetical protein